MIDLARRDLGALVDAWRTARPFPHVVLDDLVGAEPLAALRAAVAAEPHAPMRDEIVDTMASGCEVRHATLRAFQAALADEATLAAVRAITGKPVRAVEMRSYVYLAGHYLLPHTDASARFGRQVAFAYYLTPDGTCDGGELELFDCDVADDDIVATRSAGTVAHRADRLVLFDVSRVSLHQVREVRAGARVSLAGWFT